MARLGAQLLMQAALEAEVTEFLGRDRYQRAAACDGARPGSRNGYREVTVKTTAGPVQLARPKLRGTAGAFASRLFGAHVTRTNALESLVIASSVTPGDAVSHQSSKDKRRKRSPGVPDKGAKKRAIIAIAHILLKIAYAVLKAGTPCQEPGAGFCTRRDSAQAREDYLLRQLHKLHPGCVITITPTEAA